MDMHTKLIFQNIQSTCYESPYISPAIKSWMKQGYYPTRHFTVKRYLPARYTKDSKNELTSLNEDYPDKQLAEELIPPDDDLIIVFDPWAELFVKLDRIIEKEECGSSLIYAVSRRLPLPILRTLIRTGVDINATTKQHGSALNVAIRKYNIEAAKLLIACGVKLEQDGSHQHWISPLHQAINELNWEMVELLLKSGANVNSLDEKGETALNAAIWHENLDVVQLLLKAGGPNCVDQRNAEGVNALHIAIRKNNAKIAKTLLLAGANINALCRPETDKSETPFSVAVAKIKNKEVIRILLKFGGDPCLKIGHGYPVWHKAIYSDNYQCLKVLLEHPEVRLNLNERCSDGMTAVHYAATHQHFRVLEQLLLAGAEVNVMDKRQYTPLFYAASCVRWPQVLADDPWYCRTWNTLEWRVVYSESRCIELLLQHGADINTTYEDGKTLLEVDYFKESVATVLIKHLALLESCKRPVNESYTRLMYIDSNMFENHRNIYKKCNAELQAMKETTIDTGISFWNFLTGSSTTVIRYLRNLRVRQAFKKIPYKEMFSIYGNDLYIRFEITKKRGKQRRRAYRALSSLTNCTEVIIDNIFRFLPLRDLETLASIPRH